MDTKSAAHGTDGELVAVFGPSAVGLFGTERFDTSSIEQSMRDAQRFAAAEDMETALTDLVESGEELARMLKRGSEIQRYLPPGCPLQPQVLSDRIDRAKAALAKARGEQGNGGQVNG